MIRLRVMPENRKVHIFVVVFFAAEQEENQCSCYVEKPQKVWYDEVFIKWDQVV